MPRGCAGRRAPPTHSLTERSDSHPHYTQHYGVFLVPSVSKHEEKEKEKEKVQVLMICSMNKTC